MALQRVDAVPLRVGQPRDRVAAGIVERDDVAGHADDGGVRGDVRDDDGAGADARVVADLDGADELRAGADGDAVARASGGASCGACWCRRA